MAGVVAVQVGLFVVCLQVGGDDEIYALFLVEKLVWSIGFL